ncbi:MAG: ATP-binding cassette domain-containing protein [Desulfovibrio sp.]|jgi:peptide/nickel transport system ATP-binding protein|nr:ATP-binding cassette domain-containing protein [Desulfovibrio sp.]
MQALLSFHSLSRVFRQKSGILGRTRSVQAVRDVSLDLLPGRTLGVVGESGSGKSTLGRMAVGLLPPSSGEVRIRGVSLYGPDGRVASRRPAGEAQMIFQDPYSSLNPRMRVGKAVEEPLLWTGRPLAPRERIRMVEAMLEQVGLDCRQASRYPHEFSGGQRQRVAIARALITRPAFVVCDEPTSSLDASVQAQVLNLLKDMQDSMGLAYLFISHDLAVVRHMADRVAVLYRGMVVEEAEARELFRHPLHPYTRLLMGGSPGGDCAPPAADPLAGEGRDLCPFLDRCPDPLPRCLSDSVPLVLSGGSRAARCLRIAS